MLKVATAVTNRDDIDKIVASSRAESGPTSFKNMDYEFGNMQGVTSLSTSAVFFFLKQRV